MTPPICVDDIHICFMLEGQKPHIGGQVLEGAASVLVCGKQIAVEGSPCDCKGSSSPSKPKLQSGHPTILIEGKPAAGLTTDHNGIVVPTITSVLLG